jgi:hypothetical protein
MNVLLTKLNTAQLRENKKGQHREGILLQGEVNEGTGDTFKVEVGTAGTIVTMRMAANFTTLDLVGGHVIDDGICHLRGQLIDTDQNLQLFNDFIPFSLFSSPGRMKAKSALVAGVPTACSNYLVNDGVIALAAAPGANLYEPNEFTHPFTTNSYIRIDVKNDAACSNRFQIYFDVSRVTRKA